MKLGLLTDIHAGFHRYNRLNEKGVNQREADFYRAAIDGVQNLVLAGAEAIVHLGDLADTPHPKKRAVHFLIELINGSGLDWYDVDGNHTKVRMSGDIHLYDLLSNYCPRFHGYREPAYVEDINTVLIPYGTADEIKSGFGLADDNPTALLGGHFACDDVLPEGHDIKKSDLPDNRPIVLGHFHGRKADDTPTYIGATERKAWGESTNPTGVTVWDPSEPGLTFIDHDTRPWVDLTATPADYLEVVEQALYDAEDEPIARLTIAATREEYRSIDELAAHRLARNALDLSIRRLPTDEESAAPTEPVAFALGDDWRSQIAGASLPKGIKRLEVERVGLDALSSVGVAA